jgi:hypothetical protein
MLRNSTPSKTTIDPIKPPKRLGFFRRNAAAIFFGSLILTLAFFAFTMLLGGVTLLTAAVGSVALAYVITASCSLIAGFALACAGTGLFNYFFGLIADKNTSQDLAKTSLEAPAEKKSSLDSTQSVMKAGIRPSIASNAGSHSQEPKAPLFQANDKLASRIQELLKPYQFGMAADKGDCFFDSIAQGLRKKGIHIPGLLPNDCKNIRRLCHEYFRQQERIKDSWLHKGTKDDANIGGQDYQTCLSTIRYTQPEMEDLNKQAKQDKIPTRGMYCGLSTWGRPQIEGRIICEKLNISIHVIELITYEDEGVKQIAGEHRVVNSQGCKQVSEHEIELNDPRLIHIAIYRNHYVPIFPQQMANISATATSSTHTASLEPAMAYKR